MKAVIAVLCVSIVMAASATSLAQRRGGGPPGAPGGPGRGGRGGASKIERITVHGKALEGNSQAESPDRAVTVYLPPSYAGGDQSRRFPTVYMLHGQGGGENSFLETAALQQSGDRLAAAQGFSEFIVVTPNASMAKGPMYAASPATGDWERFVAEDLVGYIDSHYRTLAHRMSRGLAGHDAGASAALAIGMKHPQVFADVYAMSPSAVLTPAELEKYASNLNAFYAVAIDIGRSDPGIEPARQLHAAMTKLRIAHTFEEYDGDRSNHVRDRIEWNVLPYFARNLAAPANLTSPSPAADRLASPAR